MTMKKLKLTSKIEGDETYYLDELTKDSEIWIPKSKFIQYIKDTYLIDTKSYYNKVMESRGSSDFNKCKECGNPVRWINIFQGYSNTCTTQCRNKLLSRGRLDFVVVTRTGLITHVINQDTLTKFKVSKEIQSKIPENINLTELIEFLTENHCLWISGYNNRSIKYANPRHKNLKLKNSL